MSDTQRRLMVDLVLRGELIPKSYVDVVIRTPRKVSFDDRGRFG